MLEDDLKRYNIQKTDYNEWCTILTSTAFGYTGKQADRIILRKYSAKTVNKLIVLHRRLHYLLHPDFKDEIHEAICKVAACDSGSRNLTAVTKHYETLKELHFNPEQIVRMVAHGGGGCNLTAIIEHYKKLNELHFNAEQIVRIVGSDGGSRNLTAVIEHYKTLEGIGFNAEQIVRMVRCHGRSRNLTAVTEHYEKLQELHFTAEQIVRMVRHNGGSRNLTAVTEHYEELKELHFSDEQIVYIATHCGGSKNIEAIIEFRELLKQRNLTAEDIELITDKAKRNDFMAIVKKMATSKIVEDKSNLAPDDAELIDKLDELFPDSRDIENLDLNSMDIDLEDTPGAAQNSSALLYNSPWADEEPSAKKAHSDGTSPELRNLSNFNGAALNSSFLFVADLQGADREPSAKGTYSTETDRLLMDL